MILKKNLILKNLNYAETDIKSIQIIMVILQENGI